jgi:hypothetical protein
MRCCDRDGRWAVRCRLGWWCLQEANSDARWFFLFGFEKNERATIEPRELTVLQKTAAALLDMEPNLLERSMVEGELLEICHEKETPTE